MLIYMIVFGDTLSSVIINLTNLDSSDFFGQRVAYVTMITAMLTPLVIKKELEELKIISVFLFVAIFSFIILTMAQLSIQGIGAYNTDFKEKPFTLFWPDYFSPKVDSTNFIKSASVILVSFSCQQNLFPIYSEL